MFGFIVQHCIKMIPVYYVKCFERSGYIVINNLVFPAPGLSQTHDVHSQWILELTIARVKNLRESPK
jgi:hypothetical protein